MTTDLRAGRRIAGERAPWLSLLVAGAVSLVSGLAFVVPGLMELLIRDTEQLRAGQWWRIATPVLVQPSGWGQWAFNTAGTVLVGAAVERRISRQCWLLVFVAGGVGSVVILTLWRPGEGGGGSSDAVAALIGALAVLLCLGRFENPSRNDRLAVAYATFFAGYLSLLGPAGLWPAIVVGDLAVVTVLAVPLPWRVKARGVALLVAVAGGLMAASGDGHGIGIFLGAALAVGLSWVAVPLASTSPITRAPCE